jgi:hypothetical protein
VAEPKTTLPELFPRAFLAVTRYPMSILEPSTAGVMKLPMIMLLLLLTVGGAGAGITLSSSSLSGTQLVTLMAAAMVQSMEMNRRLIGTNFMNLVGDDYHLV